MEFANYTNALKSIGDVVVKRARLELGATRDREKRKTKWARSGNGWQPLQSQVSKAKGRINASGALSASLKWNIAKNANGDPTLEMTGNSYGVQINEGRAPTRAGGDGSVQRNIWNPATGSGWVKVKNIRLQKPGGGFIKDTPEGRGAQAFLIARKIHAFGFPATYFMRDAITQILEKERKTLLEALKKDVIQNIK